ncbi:SemD/SinC family type III secretion system effector [Candidatus Chlamydia corallus]|uniref:SemD/SinC family type III secretion system effector n=1 Tax=Candidatus Chlamydia corallus TaxID=2038470 RepID=UPI000C2FD6AE|nr:hypothetical protein [Candidatus Chlamydia corallus]
MAIGPSGRKPHDDFWMPENNSNKESDTSSSSSSSPNLGRHRVSRSSVDMSSQGSIESLREKLSRHFGAGNLPTPVGPTRSPSRPTSPPPLTSGARPKTSQTSPKPAPPPRPPLPSRPTSPPPLTSGARPKTSQTSPKPVPPPRPPLPSRPTSPSLTSGARPKTSASQPSKRSRSGQASGLSRGFNLEQLKADLKEVAKNQTQTREKLNKISEEIKSQWMNWDENMPANYQVHGYNVLLKTLMTIRNEQAEKIIENQQEKLPVLVNTGLVMLDDMVQGALYNATTFKIREEKDGSSMQLLTVLAVEGPLLASSESIKNYLRNRAVDLGLDVKNPAIKGIIKTVGNSMDLMRSQHPEHMPAVWDHLAYRLLGAVIEMKTKTTIYNIKKVDLREVSNMTRSSRKKLKVMKDLSTSVWCNAMAVLIGDLFNYGDH